MSPYRHSGSGGRFRRFGISLAGVSLLTALGLVLWLQFDSLEIIQAKWEMAGLGLTLLRLSLIAMVIATWPRLVTWISADPGVQRSLRAQRWRVAIWLIILELVLGQGLFTAFVIGLLP